MTSINNPASPGRPSVIPDSDWGSALRCLGLSRKYIPAARRHGRSPTVTPASGSTPRRRIRIRASGSTAPSISTARITKNHPETGN